MTISVNSQPLVNLEPVRPASRPVAVEDLAFDPFEFAPQKGGRCGKILVVDDSLMMRRCVEVTLKKSGVCDTVALAPDARSALDLMRAGDIDLVLCDLNMPDLNGLDFLGMIGNGDLNPSDVPVIMLTGEEGIEPKVECLESGASDYLVKPFADEELIARVRIHLQLKALQDELKAKNEQLSKQACLDGLTGISNRHHFLETMERELSRASRKAVPMSLAMIDVDHFKKVNDTHGHLCGDQALVQIARLLGDGLRNYDLLGRYGGEEFSALFVDTGPQLATRIAERCRLSVASRPLVLDDCELQLTVSIGVASAPRPDPGMVNELVSRADEALYLAKNRGRNQTVLAQFPASNGMMEDDGRQ